MTHRTPPWLPFLLVGLVAFAGGCDSNDPEAPLDETPAHAVNGSWMRMKIDGRDWTNFTEVTSTLFTTSDGRAFWLSVASAGLPNFPVSASAVLLTTTIDEGFLAPEDYSTQVRFVEAVAGQDDTVYIGAGAAVRITVVEKTDAIVKGTFTGTLTLEDGTTTVNVTEGAFVANIDDITVVPLPQ
ncbi:MAG: hypothetical protein R2834_17010 [Rhodothermales bacterium]